MGRAITGTRKNGPNPKAKNTVSHPTSYPEPCNPKIVIFFEHAISRLHDSKVEKNQWFKDQIDFLVEFFTFTFFKVVGGL